MSKSGSPRLPIQSLSDSDEAIASDVAKVGRISAVPALLALLCDHTGMGFAALARVTDGTWTACAVEDRIQFGVRPGQQLDVATTLCREVRSALKPIAVDEFSTDPTYQEHPTPRLYGIESYISVPVVLSNNVYFGNLCAVDPRPAQVTDTRTRAMFDAYAELIARQLESDQQTTAFEVALAHERQQAKLREEFIAVLGHDLRNPLHTITVIAGMMIAKPAQLQPERLGQLIQRSANRMSVLIDDVLDYARGRLGAGIGVEHVWVDDLADALTAVVAELQQAHQDREIQVSIEIGEPVKCDRGRIQQLLSNLLGNALTHGAHDRPIQVDASVVAGVVQLVVTNQGIPISADNLSHVFEPYWRTGTSGGGLGLGLYICSQIVAAHGGRMAVRSSPEHGTQMLARIPVVERRVRTKPVMTDRRLALPANSV